MTIAYNELTRRDKITDNEDILKTTLPLLEPTNLESTLESLKGRTLFILFWSYTRIYVMVQDRKAFIRFGH